MARRLLEKTLHTGEIAYLHARGLVGLDFPVLIRPMEERYSYVVAQQPFEDTVGLFYRVWEPTRAMHRLAAEVFQDWYEGRRQHIVEDNDIWEAVAWIHHTASVTPPETREQGRQYMNRVAEWLSEQSGEFVPPVSLATVAEFYWHTGGLVFPHPMTASVASATLLLMLGVPRERVCVFGIYYQDPTLYYRPNSDWRGGFLSGTPYYTVTGIFLRGQWIAVDFTLLADEFRGHLPSAPYAHLRSPRLGNHPRDGQPLVIDYAHPYTMVFAPLPYGRQPSNSPLLTRIPLL